MIKRFTILIILFFQIVLWGCSTNSSDTETYNTVPDPLSTERDTETYFFPKRKRMPLPDSILKNSKAIIKYLSTNTEEICTIHEGSGFLDQYPDRTIITGIRVKGLIHTEDENRRKICKMDITVPWNPDKPHTLPWIWNYRDELYTNPKSQAEKASWMDTYPTIYYQELSQIGVSESIYSNPLSADPHNVTLQGATEILEGSIITWEKIAIFLRAQFRVKDHAGTELEITYITDH